MRGISASSCRRPRPRPARGFFFTFSLCAVRLRFNDEHARLFAMNARAIRIAALAGLLAVALGAFGAHGLKEILARNGTAAIWDKAVFYHFIHAVMLFVLATRQPLARVAWFSFLIGVVLFSGSLYLLAVTNVRWLGAVTPLGGVSFMVGWVCLLISPAKFEK
jgi:uncharacterized membrane protein YgdD (TMEM256/DUF423 family)